MTHHALLAGVYSVWSPRMASSLKFSSSIRAPGSQSARHGLQAPDVTV